jgi:imidazolonepropionase
MANKKVLIHASEVLTGAGIRAKDGRRVAEDDLGRIMDGAVVYSYRRAGRAEVPGRIEWVGPTAGLPKKFIRLPRKNLKQEHAVVPGLVDCHTHLVFAGDRSEEFAARCGGATYAEIAAKGGGIMSTVRATRAATPAEL